MKASDFSPAPVLSEIPVDEEFMTRHAENAGRAVNWQHTRISQTRGAAESEPRAYGRDAVGEYDRRKRLHKALDRALADVGYTRDSHESQTLHEALDIAMDSGDLSEYGTQESGRKVSQDSSRSFARDVGYICDSDYVAEFLNPRQFCSDARHELYNRAYEGQRDPAKRGFWCGLIHFLSNAPDGSRVQDLNQVTLSTLLQKLNEA